MLLCFAQSGRVLLVLDKVINVIIIIFIVNIMIRLLRDVLYWVVGFGWRSAKNGIIGLGGDLQRMG